MHALTTPPPHPTTARKVKGMLCCGLRQVLPPRETQAMQLGRGFKKRIQNLYVGDVGRGLPWLVGFLSFVANL